MYAVVYARKSKGHDTETQLFRCEQQAVVLGVQIVDTYIDDDISGSKGLYRENYQRLLEDVRSGKLKDHVVLVRDQDRLTRENKKELGEWVIATEAAGIKTYNSDGSRIQDDLITDIRGAMAKEESRQIASRMRARKESDAAKGKPAGTHYRPYGYTHAYGSLVPDEVKVVREVAQRFLAGETLFGIANDLNKRGTLTYLGKQWTSTRLSQMLKKPEYAGMRTYKGEVIAQGTWRPIFTKQEHDEITAKLSKNKRFSSSTARKHLLSGILVCDECGTKLSVNSPRAKYYMYVCLKSRGGCGKLGRNKEAIEAFVIRKTYEAIKALPSATAPAPDNSAEIGRLEAKITEAREAYKADVIPLTDFVDIRNDTEAKIKALKVTQKQAPLPINTAEAFIKSKNTDKQRATIARFWPVIGVKKAGRGVKFHPNQLVFP